jgi:NAD(P)-dependent dehydrogenase (short-subunit alcohol dehydrogenase family)
MHHLEGKVAVVTGGASGIGSALADAFAAEGMRLALADIEVEPLEAATAQLRRAGADVLAVVCDVSDPDQVDTFRDEVVATYGTAHVVCNNAGVGGVPGPMWAIPSGGWDWILGVNLIGVANGIRSFVPLLIDQGEGHVVNTASAAGLVTAGGMGPYNATKQAVVAMSETLHLDLAAAGVTGVGVSVLCPAFVRTRIHQSERNAPDHLLDVFVDDGSGTMLATQSFVTALTEGGTPPEHTAEEVVAAIRDDRFYVLPHPVVRDWFRRRVDAILDDGDPAGPI